MKNPLNVTITFMRECAKTETQMDIVIEASSLLDFLRSVAAQSVCVRCVKNARTGQIIWDRNVSFCHLLTLADAYSMLA